MKLASVIGHTLDDKYLIERQLGKGGMGAVFLATHVGTGRHVAVKIIMPQFMAQDEFVERFRREARAAGRLRHPNVVDVTDFGFAHHGGERIAYLVMEYLDGCTLDEVLEEEERLPLSWVVDILEQTCSAVDEAHQQGIIHRDLKPDNIWLEPNRRGGFTVKVLDFGIAKLEEVGVNEDVNFDSSASTLVGQPLNAGELGAPRQHSEDAATMITGASDSPVTNVDGGAAGAARARAIGTEFSEGATLLNPPTSAAEAAPSTPVDREGPTQIFGTRYTDERDTQSTSAHSSLTRVGALLGTPLYMSPEQCHGKPLDPRTDVYSLGVIAYRMLSGKTPFSGNPTVVMQQHKETAPPPLIAPKTSKKLRRVVMSALSKNPEDRPAHAAAFANAMRSYSEGVGQLIQNGLMLFLQYVRKFVTLSLLVWTPMILVTIVQTGLGSARNNGLISEQAGQIMAGIIGVVTFPVQFFTAFVISAITTWLVTQLLGAPLRPLRLSAGFAALRRRWRPFVWSGIVMAICLCLSLVPFGLVILLGVLVHPLFLILMIPAIIPLVILMLGFALTVPAVMMENLSGVAALRRSLQLTQRSKRTVIATFSLQFLVPIVVAGFTGGFLALLIKVTKIPNGPDILNLVFPLVWLPAQILLGSIASVITALLYLKTRQAGGEPLRTLLRDMEDTDRPHAQWQRRMRERLSTNARSTR